MDTINQAIELSENKCPEEDWALVNVGIAPSTITITFNDSRYGFKLIYKFRYCVCVVCSVCY